MNREHFSRLAERLCAGVARDELLFCGLAGEASDFVRLNRGSVRQAGHVDAYALSLTLIRDGRQADAVCATTGDLALDLTQASHLLERLRERLAYLPEDPFLNPSTEPTQSGRVLGADPPDAGTAVAELIEAAAGQDLVGIWASGVVEQGLISSLGHDHWHQSHSFNLDWSLYLSADKALKAGYSGLVWDAAPLRAKLDGMREGLAVMQRPPVALSPGRYRAYLAPAAVQELLEMLAWGGFDLKSHRTQQTPLLKLARGECQLDARIGLREEHARGLLPAFTPDGFLKPDSVTLIEQGRYAQCLVDARSGKEYGEPVNAAAEQPESLALDAGDLPMADVLAAVGEGLYIGNLWYCNWSDTNACRMTGMTRFGSFWVADGELRAPLAAMRFDDSLYALLGERLIALTRERELLVSAQTYEGRSAESSLLPGLLVSGLDLAL